MRFWVWAFWMGVFLIPRLSLAECWKRLETSDVQHSFSLSPPIQHDIPPNDPYRFEEQRACEEIWLEMFILLKQARLFETIQTETGEIFLLPIRESPLAFSRRLSMDLWIPLELTETIPKPDEDVHFLSEKSRAFFQAEHKLEFKKPIPGVPKKALTWIEENLLPSLPPVLPPLPLRISEKRDFILQSLLIEPWTSHEKVVFRNFFQFFRVHFQTNVHEIPKTEDFLLERLFSHNLSSDELKETTVLSSLHQLRNFFSMSRNTERWILWSRLLPKITDISTLGSIPGFSRFYHWARGDIERSPYARQYWKVYTSPFFSKIRIHQDRFDSEKQRSPNTHDLSGALALTSLGAAGFFRTKIAMWKGNTSQMLPKKPLTWTFGQRVAEMSALASVLSMAPISRASNSTKSYFASHHGLLVTTRQITLRTEMGNQTLTLIAFQNPRGLFYLPLENLDSDRTPFLYSALTNAFQSTTINAIATGGG